VTDAFAPLVLAVERNGAKLAALVVAVKTLRVRRVA
jgi:hypothetical protein